MNRFDQLYKQGGWGKGTPDKPLSGSGSVKGSYTANLWAENLNKFLAEHPEIKTIVELGCGDMVLHDTILWGMRDYTCVEVSKTIADASKKKYPNKKIILESNSDNYPPADLFIAKEVLQHLSTPEVKKIMDRAVNKYPWIIVQNGCPYKRGNDENVNEWTNVKDFKCFRTVMDESPFNYKVIHKVSKNDQVFQVIKGNVEQFSDLLTGFESVWNFKK